MGREFLQLKKQKKRENTAYNGRFGVSSGQHNKKRKQHFKNNKI